MNTNIKVMEKLLREAQKLQLEAFQCGQGFSISFFTKGLFSINIENEYYFFDDFNTVEENEACLEQARAYMDKLNSE